MALSIGSVNFGVDANTTGLRKAIQQLDAFQRRTDKVAKSQSSAAQATARAMSRQESAIKGAFQQVLRLQQQFRRLDKELRDPSDIARSSNAFRKLTKEMTSGKLSAVEFTRSMDAFNATMGRTRRRLSDLKAQQATAHLGGLAGVIRNLESASVLAVGPLSGLGSRIRAIASITTRSTLALAAFFGVITGGIVVMAKLTAGAINAQRVFEQAEARFLATSDSLVIAEKQMAFVIKTSRELGLRIDTSAKSFSRLVAATRGTALEGEGTRKIFEGISKAAAALRLENVAVEGTFRALEQIISKGSVQAEELRGQLGERLPGAFRIAAESMNLTTKQLGDMLKTGEVLADDFVPKFVAALDEAFGDRAKGNVDSFGGSMNNLASAALLFNKHFDEVTNISKVAIGAIQALTAAIDFLRENLVTLAKIIGAVTGALLVLAGPAIIRGVIALAKAMVALARATFLFNAALLANPIGRIVGWIVKLVAVIGGAIAGWLGMKFAIGETEAQLDELDATLDKIAKDALTDMGNLTDVFNEMRDEVKDLARETQVYQQALGQLRGQTGVEEVRKAFADMGPLMDLNINKVASLAQQVIGPLNTAYETVLANMAGATEPEEVLRLFQAMNDVMVLNQKEMSELAASIGQALGKDVNRDFMSVTLALYEMRTASEEAKTAFKEFGEEAEQTNKTLSEAGETLGAMALRLQALREGPQSVKFFDEVTAKVREFTIGLAEGNVPLEVRNQLAATYKRFLIETIALEEDHDRMRDAQRDKERADQKALKDRIRQIDRVNEVLGETDRQFTLMREKIAAIASGPRSLQIFEEVQEPLSRLREKMIEAGVPLQLMNQQLAMYKGLLEELVRVQNIATGAATQTSDAIINSLENMITLSESVKESLMDLARELFRIFLRAKLLDPLRDSLISGFTNLFSGGGGANPFSSVLPGQGPPRATGGGVRPGMSYPVGENGMELFTPGVSGRITPHSQVAGMIGGVNLTINAPGSDVGTIARIKEIVRVELGPQMVKAATQNTMTQIRRPRFA